MKNVYLDSNDFSALSEPSDRLTAVDQAVLEKLKKARASGDAKFFISPIHISEAVHASDSHKDEAVRRAALMRDLSDRNILRFPTDICRIELTRAFAGEDRVPCSLEEISSGPNEWFGIPFKNNLDDRRKEIDNEIETALKKLNRKDRRRRRSELDPEKKSSHPLLRALLKDGLRNSAPGPFPATLADPELTLNWYLGEVTDEAFRSNTMKLLSDPYLLFKHFIDALGHRNQLYNIIRDQESKWRTIIESGMSQVAPAFALAKKGNHPVDLRKMIGQITNESFWRAVIGALAEADLTQVGLSDIVRAKEKSPSTSVFMHAVLESVRVRLQSTQARAAAGNLVPASVKLSDYGDFMHAIYAPYFDVFRCDSAFGDVLKSHPNIRTKIVTERRDLLIAL